MRLPLCFLFFLQLALSATSLAGDLWLPAVFSNHAVLQRGTDTPVWGKAPPNAEVGVLLGDRNFTTKADAEGNWKVLLDLKDVGPEPFQMAIRSGLEEVVLIDVLVGEVWLASGQSNMVRTLGRTLGAGKEIPKSANASLRCFSVTMADSDNPAQDIKGEWKVASPKTSPNASAVAYYFAKSLQETMKVPVGIIISAVGSAQVETWTSNESLSTVPGLATAAEKVRIQTAGYPEAKATYQQALKQWLQKTNRADRREVAPEQVLSDEFVAWEKVSMPYTPSDMKQPGAVWLRTLVEIPSGKAQKTIFLPLGVVQGFDEVYWNGQKIGVTPIDEALSMIRRDCLVTVPREVVRGGSNDLAIRLYLPNATPFLEVASEKFQFRNGFPISREWRQHREYSFPALKESEAATEPNRPLPPPSSAKSYSKFFNAMLHPLAPYGLAGVIWYQGEANTSRAAEYRTAFPLLIKDWRKLWSRNDLPFYWVQLPAHLAKTSEPQPDSDWAALREAQTMTLALPFTGQAVTLDLGEAEDIHPTEKAPVGQRLAAIALAKTYGQSVPFQGPDFDSARFADGKAVVSFSNTAGGLVEQHLPEKHALSKIPPRYAPLVRNSPNSQLEGFELFGEDGVWHWADARINGSQVVVSSAAVSSPLAVRHAWADNPTANLWGKNGFPAGPFRTEISAVSATTPIPNPHHE